MDSSIQLDHYNTEHYLYFKMPKEVKRIEHTESIRKILLDHLGSKDKDMVLDFTGTEYVDSGIISIIVRLKDELHENGKKVGLVCRDKNINGLFMMVGLDLVVDLFESMQEVKQHYEENRD